ncbi:MAG: alpha/beta fold hydrolase [Leptospiraceae bacterium]|nr:alpha/beta fold hydrolase [Leptospiraceae bacterium]
MELQVYKFGNEKHLPIVFIHGFPLEYKMWSHQFRYLQNENHCISYDIRGLGESSAGDGQFTVELFVDDLFEILDKHEIPNPILCGLSMGGYIALRAMVRHQNRFRGLILCDTRSEADNNDAKLKRAVAIQKINKQGLENYIDEFIPNCFFSKTKSEKSGIIRETVEKAKKFDPIGVKGCLLAMAGRMDCTHFLGNIVVPTLLLCGEHDTLTTPDMMENIAHKIPNSEFTTVPNAGHLAPLENPEYVNRSIENFLRKNFYQSQINQ